MWYEFWILRVETVWMMMMATRRRRRGMRWVACVEGN